MLRFLWTPDVSNPRAEFQAFRFTRVVFGVLSSPFLLNATVDHHLRLFSETHPEFIETLICSIYVDDIIAGATSMDAALKFYRESKNILKKGGFNFCKFRTNLPQLQIAIDELEDSLLKDNADTTSTRIFRSVVPISNACALSVTMRVRVPCPLNWWSSRRPSALPT